jgi:hypothetical protein
VRGMIVLRDNSMVLRDNSKYRDETSEYWRQHAKRARKLAEQVRQSAKYAPQKLSKQRIFKLAKRYDQMATLAEERASRSTTEIFSRSTGVPLQTYLRVGP